MANPPRKASSSNKRKEMATKPTSPQSKKRVSVGARTSEKGKTATKSPAKRSRAGTRSTRNISTVETQSTHVDPVLEMSLQAVPSIGTSESNAISLADLSREMVQAAQEKGIAVPRMSEIEAEYKKNIKQIKGLPTHRSLTSCQLRYQWHSPTYSAPQP